MESGCIFIGSVLSSWKEEYERVGMKSDREFALHLLETHKLNCFRELCRRVHLSTSSPKSKVHVDAFWYKSDDYGLESKISDSSVRACKETDIIYSITEPEVHGDPRSCKSNGCDNESKMSCEANADSKQIDDSFSFPCSKNEMNSDIFDDSITLGASEDMNYDIGFTRKENMSLHVFDYFEEKGDIYFQAAQQEGFGVANHQDETDLFLFEEDQFRFHTESNLIPIPEVKQTTRSLKEECIDEANVNLPNFTELLTSDDNRKNVNRSMEPCQATRVVPKTQIVCNPVFPTNLKKSVLISSCPMSSATPIVKQSSILPPKVHHVRTIGSTKENIKGHPSIIVQNTVDHDSKLNEKVQEQDAKISSVVRLPMRETANNAMVLDSQTNEKVVNIAQRNQTTPPEDKTDCQTLQGNGHAENFRDKDINNSCVAQILKGGIDNFNSEKRNHLRKSINKADLTVSLQNKENFPAFKNETYQKESDVEATNKRNNTKKMDTASKTYSEKSSPSNAFNCDPNLSFSKAQNSNPEIGKCEESSLKDNQSLESQIPEDISEKLSPQKVDGVDINPSPDNIIHNNVINGENTDLKVLKIADLQQNMGSRVDDISKTEEPFASPITSVSDLTEVCDALFTSKSTKRSSEDNTEVHQDENVQALSSNTSTSQLSDFGPQTEKCTQNYAGKSHIPQDMMVMAEVLLEISRSRPPKSEEIESDGLNDKSKNKNSYETCDKERCGRRTLFKRRKSVSKLLHNSKLNMLKAKYRTIPKTYSKIPNVESQSSHSRYLRSRYLRIHNRSRVNKTSDTRSPKNEKIRLQEYKAAAIKTIPRGKKNKRAHQITKSGSEDASISPKTDSQIDWEHGEIILEPMDIEIREETILTAEFYPEHKELSARIRQIDSVRPLDKPKEIVGYTVTTVNSKKSYTCDFCGLSFPRLKDIETHIKESYDTPSVQTVTVVTNDNLHGDKDPKGPKNWIRKRTFTEKSFVCEFLFCDQTFVTKKDYKKHVVECHLSSTSSGTVKRNRTGHPSVCSTCGNKFSSKRRLHLHVKNCHPTKSSPMFKNRLKDKAKTIRKRKQTWLCKYCDQRFVIKRDLIKHVMDIHANLKPQIQSKLPKTHTCNFCQENFPKRKLLGDHLQLEHNHPPGYAKPAPKATRNVPKLKIRKTKYCGYCELSFMDKKLLENHLIEDHKITPKVKRSVTTTKMQKSMHRCGSCEAGYSKRDYLEKHWCEEHKFFSIIKHGKDQELQNYQCSVCDFSSTDLKLLEKHLGELHNFQLVMVSKATAISCCICDHNFNNDDDLAVHFKDIHFISLTGNENTEEPSVLETKNTLHCKICDTDLSESNIFEHMKCKHRNDKSVKKGKKSFNCKYCEQIFVTKKQLTLHTKELHVERETVSDGLSSSKSTNRTKRQKPDPVTHYCNFCELSSMKKRELKLHTAECHDKPKVKKIPRSYQCDFCELSFPKRGLLSHHVKTDHPAVLNLSIITGQNGDGDPEILERDYEVIGDIQIKNRKIFTCDFCTFMFVKQKLLHAHIKECHKDCQYQCGVCGKLFSNKSRWNSHLKLHQPDPPFKCHCGKAFPFRYLLNAHVNQVHVEVKKHMCDYCGKTFSTSRILRDHLLTHTKEQPFVCEVCNKGFSQAFNLKRHLWTHTGEKPYSCKICLKSFRGSTDLKRHSLIHISQKPHRCELCDLSFRQLSHLNTHRKKQHKRSDPYLL